MPHKVLIDYHPPPIYKPRSFFFKKYIVSYTYLRKNLRLNIIISFSGILKSYHSFSIFGKTYCCESLYSTMKFVKTKHRSQLTNQHLKEFLRTTLINFTPNFKNVEQCLSYSHQLCTLDQRCPNCATLHRLAAKLHN